jgi:hypothetical protein
MATALINPLLNELPVLSAGDFHAIAKMEEDILSRPFGQTHFRLPIADCPFIPCLIWRLRYEGIFPFPQRGHRVGIVEASFRFLNIEFLP